MFGMIAHEGSANPEYHLTGSTQAVRGAEVACRIAQKPTSDDTSERGSLVRQGHPLWKMDSYQQIPPGSTTCVPVSRLRAIIRPVFEFPMSRVALTLNLESKGLTGVELGLVSQG